ncbi:MAG TPA: glycosyltransferase family 4 protein [Planctomycetaceae bacterium]|nr:glycosyltransferase family 4 protein [Planctomycetaceae bacterium]
MMRVLVCHGGRQHSHHLAMALASRGMLAKYVTGLPTQRHPGGWLGRFLFPKKAEAYAIPIDPALVKHVYLEPVARRVTRGLGPKWSRAAGSFADRLFDRWVCGLVGKLRPDVVVAYETGALCIFRTAKELGVKTVLDAASIHHRWQDRFLPAVESEAAHRRTNLRKDAEIELADEILVVSKFACQSYVDCGVSSERVHAMPLGVDTNRFRPDDRGVRAHQDGNQHLRFVYVGNESQLKGVEVLYQAVALLRAAGEKFTATMIGGSSRSPDENRCGGIVRKPWMSHDLLSSELAGHDVLILPSFFDSFGMVVAEAMACGLPAIVTENVGAKEMITDRENGLVIPAGQADALVDAMRWFIAHRHELPTMSLAARKSAEQYDWTNYRQRVTEFLASIR